MKNNRKWHTLSQQKRQTEKRQTRKTLTYAAFESRQLLASVGWDGPGQGSAELTYFVGNAPNGITQDDFESTVEDALEVWADEIDVTFTQTSLPNQPDSIDFTSVPIDGSGGVLARAYFPDDLNRGSIAGDVQFDSLDQWEIGNDQGFRATDLMHVAVHEIGHSLGIEHIDDHDSVLADTVSRNQSFDGLSQHDIDAAMALYAPANPTSLTSPVDVPVTTENPAHVHPESDSNTPELPSVEQPTATDSNPEHDRHEPEHPSDDTPDHDDDSSSRRRRFWRIINHFVRKFRFSFWNQVAFLRW